MRKKTYKLVHLIMDEDKYILEKYETTFKTYEDVHKELEKIVGKALTEYDPDVERTVLENSVNCFRYLDLIDVSNLWPNVRQHSYKIKLD